MLPAPLKARKRGRTTEHLGEVSYAAREASYGCGRVLVANSIAGASFTTSLFPRDGGYLLPLKAAVRAQVGIAPRTASALACASSAPAPDGQGGSAAVASTNRMNE